MMSDPRLPVQASLSELEGAARKRKTRRGRFLADIKALTPQAALLAAIAPVFPKGEGQGRLRISREKMPRMCIAQQCFRISDGAIEDAPYDTHVVSRFVGMDPGHERAQDATTLLKLRRLLEDKRLTATLFATSVLSRNSEGKPDPDMRLTKKVNRWRLG
jgi:IS5 family transposase